MDRQQNNESLERRADFLREADRRFAEFLFSGESIAWQDMRAWMRARAKGRWLPLPFVHKPGP